ncbi:MAG: BON domain-containing protein [Pirellulales bacterium]
MELCNNNLAVHAMTGPIRQEECEGDAVEAIAARILAQHPLFCGRTAIIDVEYRQGTLTISGRVPSFYLKQVVQELFRQLDGVERVDNRVDVVCPCGLSSVRQPPEVPEYGPCCQAKS